MNRSLISTAVLALAASISCAAQSPDSAPSSPSAPAKPAPAAQTPDAKAATSDKDASKDKKKPKKVWTNDEVSSLNGNVSVVGSAPASSTSLTAKPGDNSSSGDSRAKQIARYRDQIRPLRQQLEITEKQLSDVRNFKGENSSSSGGINMSQNYSMTPVEDQVKQLEAKRKDLQKQIEAIEDEARKNGVEPGQLR
jgi:chromosome segregation ATPase